MGTGVVRGAVGMDSRSSVCLLSLSEYHGSAHQRVDQLPLEWHTYWRGGRFIVDAGQFAIRYTMPVLEVDPDRRNQHDIKSAFRNTRDYNQEGYPQE